MGAAIALSGLLLGATACDDERRSRPEGQLSEQAQKGLEIAPFPIDVTGLSLADKELLGRGSYLVNSIGGCVDCHNTNGAGWVLQVPLRRDCLRDRRVRGDRLRAQPHARPGHRHEADRGRVHRVDAHGQGLQERQCRRGALRHALALLPVDDHGGPEGGVRLPQEGPRPPQPGPRGHQGRLAAGRPVPFSGSYNEGAVTRTLPAESSADTLNSNRGLAIQPLADPCGAGHPERGGEGPVRARQLPGERRGLAATTATPTPRATTRRGRTSAT